VQFLYESNFGSVKPIRVSCLIMAKNCFSAGSVMLLARRLNIFSDFTCDSSSRSFRNLNRCWPEQSTKALPKSSGTPIDIRQAGQEPGFLFLVIPFGDNHIYKSFTLATLASRSVGCGISIR